MDERAKMRAEIHELQSAVSRLQTVVLVLAAASGADIERIKRLAKILQGE